MNGSTDIHLFISSDSFIISSFPRADPVAHPENMDEPDIINLLSVIRESDCDHTVCSLMRHLEKQGHTT